MGLIRYTRPVANAVEQTWGVVGGVPAWDAIDDEFRPYVARGTIGGALTDPVDDTHYVSAGGAGLSESAFTFGSMGGDDDLAYVRGHVRARNTTSAPVNITVVFRDGGFLVGLDGTFAIPMASSFAEYTADLTLAGIPLTPSQINNGDFGLSVTIGGFGGTVDVSRFYLEVAFVVGPTLGKRKIEENWRFCDVCGLKVPYSRVQRPAPPHPQSGLVVCFRCYDQPDHDTIKIMNASIPRDEVDTLY